jgi:hypothetical protein
MKTEFSPEHVHAIRQAKATLRHLWQQSGLKPAPILALLAEKGHLVKNSTFSTWMSIKDGNTIRPRQEILLPLLEILMPDHSAAYQQELALELSGLLGYHDRPLSSEEIRNRISEQLDGALALLLENQPSGLERHLHTLEQLWAEIEPAILDFDRGFPVVRVERDNLSLLRKLAGTDKKVQQSFAVTGGYEIPLSRIQSTQALSDILNLLNEGGRVLHALIERHLVDEGYLDVSLSDAEERIAYIWEISDRLLNNNLLCKTVPPLRKTLLQVMSVAGGIRFLLHNQTEPVSEGMLEKILSCKGGTSEAGVKCAVAVYVGILARQYLKQERPLRRALGCYTRALRILKQWQPRLESEQERFYYLKEMANLCFDLASLLLWRSESAEISRAQVLEIMAQASQYYQGVLESPNLFFMGLSEARANHIRAFYMISLCWSCARPARAVAMIHSLSSGEHLNERFWFIQISQAVAWSILHLRFGRDDQTYRQAARQALERAQLVPGCQALTAQELRDDWVLAHMFGLHAAASDRES